MKPKSQAKKVFMWANPRNTPSLPLGACFEANIARIPAIALSQAMNFEDHRNWYTERRFSVEALERMTTSVTNVFPRIWAEYALPMDSPITWSFNLPDHTEDLEIIRTRLGQTFYQRCYSQRGDQFYHDLQRFPIDDAPDSDQAVVFDGHVSATRIDLAEIGQNPDG